MSSVSQLPDGYVAPEQLTLCSNVLRQVPIPLSVDAIPVLLVGKGRVPLVWLNAPIGGPEQRWSYIVRASQAANPAVVISVDVQNSAIEVRVGGQVVLKAHAVSPDEIVVSHIDLRPIGFDIQGDATKLSLGSSQLIRNTFQNVNVAFASSSGSAPGA